MSVKVTRYSGYRIHFLPPQSQDKAWTDRRQDIQRLIPFVDEARKEAGYLFDDAWKPHSSEELLMQALQRGELFVVEYEHEQHGNIFMGLILLEDIGRDALLTIWAHPAARGKLQGGQAVRKVFNYCFRPFTDEKEKGPRGLGLVKIRSKIAVVNEAACRGAARLGFEAIGISKMEGLFQGKLMDMILVEKYNPAYCQAVPPEEITDGRQETNDTSFADATGSATSSSAVDIGSGVRPTSKDGGTVIRGGGSRTRKATGIRPTKQPPRPKAARATTKSVLPAVRKAGNRAGKGKSSD